MSTIANKTATPTMLDASHQVKLRHQAARPAAPGPGPTHKPVVKPGEHPCACDEKDEDVTRSSRRTLDRFFNAWLGHLTAGVSPASIMGAYADWIWHLAMSPGKQGQLMEKYWRKAMGLAAYLPHAPGGCQCEPCICPLPHDTRFKGDAWQEWPFNIIYQSFLLTQQWWHNATTDINGVRDRIWAWGP
jgi:polyhydroxyalkanoate synthase